MQLAELGDVTDYIEFNVEPYIKYFNQLIEINRNKIVPQDPDFATETGKTWYRLPAEVRL